MVGFEEKTNQKIKSVTSTVQPEKFIEIADKIK